MDTVLKQVPAPTYTCVHMHHTCIQTHKAKLNTQKKNNPPPGWTVSRSGEDKEGLDLS